MIEKLKPPFVLFLIATLVSAALVVTYNLTYVDLSGMLTEEMQMACDDIFGGGSFELMDTQLENVNAVIAREEGGYAFDITVDGYNTDGIRVMVGIDEGAVVGVYTLAVAETPGVGTQVEDAAFLEQFVGASGQLSIPDDISAITGATISSKALTNAVNIALTSYGILHGEEPEAPQDDEESDAPQEGDESEPTESEEPVELTQEQLQEAASEIFGGGSFTETQADVENVNTVFAREEGGYAFDITVDGYTEGGIRVMVGIDEAAVVGVKTLAILDTPNVGTQVEDATFLAQFEGASGQLSIPDDISVITGATVSSKAVANAVNIALSAYDSLLGAQEEPTLTQEMESASADIFGGGSFALLETDLEGVDAVLAREEGGYAFDITVDGYNKNGIRVMVGMNEAGVVGVSILDINETPNIGTQVQDSTFLAQFEGATESLEAGAEIDVIIGATLSSKGVVSAVNLAIETYQERGSNGIE